MERHNATVITALLCSAVFANVGCDFSNPKAGLTESTLRNGGNGTIRGYETLRSEIFLPKCIPCHGNSGGVSLETYSAAQSVASRIGQVAGVAKSMPPTGALSAREIALIEAWVNGGAPEVDTSVVSPAPTATPAPSSSPVALSYANVAAQVFTPYCVSCHGTSGSGGVSLNTYVKVVSSISAVQQEALTTQAMPPNGALPQAAQTMLRQWIAAGTPQ